ALGAGSLTIAGGSLGNSSGAAVTLTSNPQQNWSNDFSFAGPNALGLGTGGVTLSGNRLVTVSSSTLTVGGIITDLSLGYGLTKAGSGSLVLSSANTFNGGFSLSAGTVVAGTVGALSNGALTVSAGSLSLGGVVQSFSGQVTISGGVVFNGTLSLSGSDLALSGGVVLANLDGPNGIAINGSSLATLGAANSFSGNTTLTAGTLALNNNAALGSGLLIINGGSLTNTSGNSVSVGNGQTWAGSFGFSGSNSLALTGPATLGSDIVLSVDGAKLTQGGALTGGYTLTKVGAGSLEFAASSPSFSGTLNLNAGTVRLSATNAFPAIKALSVNAGSLDLGGNSQAIAGSTNFSVQGGTVSNGTLVVAGSVNLVAGSVSATILGTGVVVKSGSGSAALAPVNAYSGGTTINSGTLFLGGSFSLGSGSLTLSGGTLANATGSLLSLGSNNSQIWAGSFAYLGTGGLNAGSGAVTLTNNVGVNVVSGSLLVGGTISGAFGFDKSGVGSLLLSGSNLYTGATSVSAGTLRAGTFALSTTSGISIAAPASLIADGIGMTVPSLANSGSVSFTANTGTITLSSVSGSGITNYASNAVFLSTIGSGTHNVTNFMSGDISGGFVSANFAAVGTLSGGTLSISNSSRLSTINLLSGGAITNNGSLLFTTGTLTGALDGFGPIEKSGASSTLALNGDNPYWGNLTVSAGTLLAKNFTGLPTLSVSGSSTVNVYGGGSTNLWSLANNGGSVSFSGATSSASLYTYSGSGTTTFANEGIIGWGPGIPQDNLITAGSVISNGNLWVIGTISGGFVSARSAAFGQGALGLMSISGGTLMVTDEANLLSISGSSTVVVQSNNQSTSEVGWISGGSVSLQGRLQMNGGLISGGDIYVGQAAGVSGVDGGTLTVQGEFNAGQVNGGSLFLSGNSTITDLRGGTLNMHAPLNVRIGTYTGTNGGISGDATFTKILRAGNATYQTSLYRPDGNYILPLVGKAIGADDIGSNFHGYNGVHLPTGGTLQNITTGTTFTMPGVGYLDTDGVAKRNDDVYSLTRYSDRLDLMGVNTYTGDTVVSNGVMVVSAGAIQHTSKISVVGGVTGTGFTNGSKTIVSGSVTFVNAFTGIKSTVVGQVTNTTYAATMGGSLTAVDVNPSGQTSLVVSALGIATFSGSNLGFSTIQNDAPAFFYVSTTPGAATLSGSYLATQLGVYFTNAAGTITVGSITGSGYTRFAGNLAGGVIDVTSPGILQEDYGLNTGVVVDKVLYSDVRSGQVTAGALDLANITGGSINSVRSTGGCTRRVF
ncbi:MAG: hypothetical protein EBS01_05020, partial [Verrucomicrobia bacterium]|nr:hypothetical protein [Verrucomicrobiota bacterium]